MSTLNKKYCVSLQRELLKMIHGLKFYENETFFFPDHFKK